MPTVTAFHAQELIDAIHAGKSPATRAAYLSDLKDFVLFRRAESAPEAIADLLAGDFDRAQSIVESYRTKMVGLNARDLSSSLANRRLTVLRRIARAAHRRGWTKWVLDVHNAREESVKTPVGPERSEAAKMLEIAASDDSPSGRRTYAILRLFLDLGLRRGAISGSDILHFSRANATLLVKLKGHEKRRKKSLAIPTVTALVRWLEVHPNPRQTSPLFVNLIPGRHTRLSGPAVYNLITAISERAGCRTHPHALRHTAITQAIDDAHRHGKTLDQVRQFSDHKDFRMVLRYRDSREKVQVDFSQANARAFGDPLSE